MVRRIVALLLVGAWQLQAVVPPHIHAGMSAEDLISHGERHHFHWSHESHAHHDHAHGAHDRGHSHPHATLPEVHFAGDLAAPPADHDDDAVYLDAGSLANVPRTSPYLAPPDVVTFAASVGDMTSSLEQHTSARPRYGGQVPAFLGTTRLLL